MDAKAAGVLSTPDLVASDLYETTSIRGVATGAGSLRRLPQLVNKLASDAKVLIVTGRTLAASELSTRVKDALGSRYVGIFSQIGEHAPEADIDQALGLIEQLGANVLIGFGGGSPIDACKVLAWKHHERHPDGPWLRHVALPTTLSAAECSIIGGYTSRDKIKVAVEHIEICPAYIIYDPALTLLTPEKLWLSTGIRAVDHAVENLYRPSSTDYHKALSLAALRSLFTNLPASKADPSNVEVRGALLIGAWQSIGLAKFARPLGLSHGLSKRLGATLGIPHGITSCICLPPAIRAMHESANQPFTATDLSYIDLAVAAIPTSFTDATVGQPGPLRLSAAVAQLVEELDLAAEVSSYGSLGTKDHERFVDAAIMQFKLYGWTDKQLPTRDELVKMMASL